MPSRYTRLWRVLPFAIMRFNMVSYRYRSRLLSDFSAILFQLFSVTSGFSLSLSTDTNHIETHYRISVLSLGKFTIYCNGLAFYSPADSLGIFQIMCFNMVHIEIHSGNRTQRIVLQSCTSRTVATVFECISIWCPEPDSNRHALSSGRF